MITVSDIQANPAKYKFRFTAKFKGEVIWQSDSVLATDVDGRRRLDKEQEAKQLEFSKQYGFPAWRDRGSMVGGVYEVN